MKIDGTFQKVEADSEANRGKLPPIARCCVGGALMGLANLVPGVSGGTMILIMGLYDEFISAVADATRFQFSRRNLLALGLIGGAAAVTIVALAKVFAQLVILHPLVMYSLFIGMTLGGVPLLWKLMRPISAASIMTFTVGVILMVGIAISQSDAPEPTPEEKARLREAVSRGEFELKPTFGVDVAAGILGMSAMVLPGISGAYMLVLIERYDQILAAISITKAHILSLGRSGSAAGLHILIPVAIGAVVSLVAVTNLIKWLLRRHQKPTVGFLLGIVISSAFTIWEKVGAETGVDHALALGILMIGLVGTMVLSRLGGPAKEIST